MADPPLAQPNPRLPVTALSKYIQGEVHPGGSFTRLSAVAGPVFVLYLEMLEFNLPPGEHLSDARKEVYLAIQLGAEGLRIFRNEPRMERRADAGTS